MAIKLSDQYPGRANPPSVDYPNGSIKNRSAPGVLDGTPLDQAWANDKEGFFQSILVSRGITANGEVDRVGASQYYDALAADPTEAARGLPLEATQEEVNTGDIEGKLVSPKKLRAGFNYLFQQNGFVAFPTWLGGLIIQWGLNQGATSGMATISLPTAFKQSVYALSSTKQSGYFTAYVDKNGSSLSTIKIGCQSGAGWGADYMFWIAIGV